MARFTVTGVLHVGVYTIVEADNETRAREIAEGRDIETVADAVNNNGEPDKEWCLQDGIHNGEVEVGEGEDGVELDAP